MTYRQTGFLLACSLLLAGCGKKPPATPVVTDETPASVVGKSWMVPDLGLELVAVPPGSFQMGSEDGSPDERPVHQVRVTHPFWMGKYEVTQAEYEAVTGSNPSESKGPKNPLEKVSWNDAAAFCAKLTVREHRAGRLLEGHEFRLPTEAEWEYAARGGPGGRNTTYAGSDDVDEVAWYNDNPGRKIHEVGTKKANELELYDMSGNVYEWCLDWYDAGYFGTSPPADPRGPATGSTRVVRGGSFLDASWFVRSANRFKFGPTYSDYNLGFRVVLAPAIEQPEK